ncbi:MAG: ABC transporter permease [Nibricoccus sp.]
MFSDLKFAFRQLAKAPGFSAVAVFTLALGLAVNAVFFSITNDLFFRPLPAKDPDELVIIAKRSSAFDYQVPLSYPDAQDFRSMLGSATSPDLGRAFVDVMAFREEVVSFAINGRQAERSWIHFGSDNYFSLLGVQPHRGRFFLPSEATTPGSEPVIVLTYDYWRTRFHEDDSVVGQSVKLNGIPFTVIGVAPRGFFGALWGTSLSGFVPVTTITKLVHGGMLNRGNTCTFLMGRLRPGVDLKQAQAAAELAFSRMVEANPGYYPPAARAVVMKESNSRPSPYVAHHAPKIVLALNILALLVLAVAVANVAGLLYARAASRERELAIRAALGASRFRIVRGLLAESTLLALAAGFIGLVTSLWLAPLFDAFAPSNGAPPAEIAVDWRPFVVCGLTALLVGFVAGLLPALKASGMAPLVFLKETSNTSALQRHPLRRLLVVGQVALSCVVLICASLALRSLVLLTKIPTGFRTDNLVVANYDLNLQNYSSEQGRRFHELLLEKVRALPGVEAASITTGTPVDVRINQIGNVTAEGEPSSSANERAMVSYVVAENSYPSTISLPVEKGRSFDSRDQRGSQRVVLINQALSRRLFGDKDPISRKISIQGDHGVEVIGVLAKSRYYNLADDSRPLVIDLLAQNYQGNVSLVVRSGESAASVADALTKAIHQIDPALPLYDVKTLRQRINESPAGLMPYRLGAILASSQGLIALLLAGAGIFGLIAFSVTKRTREIGVRMALGASRMQVIRAVTRESLMLTLSGVIVGLACSAAIAHLLSDLLYGAGKFEIVIFGGVALLLFSAAALACWLPARRAIRINPIEALRAE